MPFLSCWFGYQTHLRSIKTHPKAKNLTMRQVHSKVQVHLASLIRVVGIIAIVSNSNKDNIWFLFMETLSITVDIHLQTEDSF
ncbi:MAG TPA: hypothetical protein VER14_08250 [Phototrophicaceae bacterium]|nr:hypothetical protein [Phototrophicaceae bacterium]